MQNIETKNSNEQESSELKKTPSTQSNSTSVEPSEGTVTLGPLSKDLAKHLLELSKKVTSEEVTPQTVNAACQCASELHKIMRLNWEMRSRI